MFNPAQQSVKEHGLLESGFSVIFQMPTGSGKTWLAKQALTNSLNRGLRGIYLAPLKALAEEISDQWKTEFEDSQIGQGREKVKILLKEDKKLRNKIEKQVKSYLGL